ncbi:MAG: hypothetical protein QGH93_05195 [Gammaproteobacteria bacterium]|jgi:hypothetical protein|nr:hypothetical protein [Chromatiales bacterium]MDP6674233.1 hypothetical protein [Gammaproteobacteria bacterium]
MKNLSRLGRVLRFIIPCCLLAVVAVADDDNKTGSDANAGEDVLLEKCAQTNQIRHTSIVDDQTILFYMNQQKIFVNQLPHRCGGLRIAGAFSYRLTNSRLCDIDTIKVVRTFGGRLDTGPSCGLGKFRLVTEEEVAQLRNKDDEKSPQDSEPAETTDQG